MPLLYLFLMVVLLVLVWVGGYKSRPKEAVTMLSEVPLSDAKLCLDCEIIFNNKSGVCPRCGSKFDWPLATWIGTMASCDTMVKTPTGWIRKGE